jgi:UDP-N-acetylglucosamine 2-epimerase (non-hydrolysing)
MEAGNRCYDENVPEETNRKVIDSVSEFLLPYTGRSREILLTE